jgi:hypothetical protein
MTAAYTREVPIHTHIPYNYTIQLYHTTIHYYTLLYTTLLYTTIHYYTLLYTTIHYTTLLYTTLHSMPICTQHRHSRHCEKLARDWFVAFNGKFVLRFQRRRLRPGEYLPRTTTLFSPPPASSFILTLRLTMLQAQESSGGMKRRKKTIKIAKKERKKERKKQQKSILRLYTNKNQHFKHPDTDQKAIKWSERGLYHLDRAPAALASL